MLNDAPAVYFGALALEPRGGTLLVRRLAVLVVDQHGRFRDPVSQRFPALDLDAFIEGVGYEFRPGCRCVEVLHDHRRVVERAAVVEHQRRHLAERVELRHTAGGR